MKLDTHHKPIEKRIQIFERRFGKTHLFFAYHAAFPLALTPDLLQCLWANFRFDTRGEVLDIPWVAVNDFLLSGLCEEVGEELYEMDAEIRNLLLDRLQAEENFQEKRIQELSRFLLAYADPLTKSSDRDRRDFGQAQRWTGLAYSQPEKAARELALELSKTYQDEKNREDILRISEIVEILKNPLSEFEQLLNYSRGMVDLIRGNTKTALNCFEKLSEKDGIVQVAGVNCLIPQFAGTKEIKKSIRNNLPLFNLLHILLFVLFTLIGGCGLWIYNMQLSLKPKFATKMEFLIPSELLSSTSISRQQAINLIQTWQNYKRHVFAPPYKRSLASQVLTGKAYRDNISRVDDRESAVNWLANNNAYYSYGLQRIDRIEYFISDENQAVIDAVLTEERTLYRNGRRDSSNSAKDTRLVRFNLQLENGKWKIADYDTLKIL